jgi:hypothetical protein
MQRKDRSVENVDANFVDDYVDATGAAFVGQPFGAHKCKQLGRDLGRMHARGVLTRWACGLPSGDAAMGFPKWVWTYSIAQRD